MNDYPDNSTLKKRLSTYRTAGGRLKNVSDDLLMDILMAWESWPSTAGSFYTSIGSTYRQMARLMSKAKELKRSGILSDGEFKEVIIEAPSPIPSTCSGSISMMWEKGRVIRFPHVDQLVEFLKKTA